MSEKQSMGASAQPAWMVVRLGDELAALPISAVGEVMPAPQVWPVPLAPPWVVGVVDVRGAIVTVIDPGLRLHGRPAAADAQMVLVGTDDPGEQVGLLVDGIAGLLDQDASRADAPELDLAGLLAGS